MSRICFEDFRNPAQLVLIAGPCVIESEEHVHRMADAISSMAAAEGFPYVFKASFDKANRTSLKGYRGPGLVDGLQILGSLRKLGFSILTDIHEPNQAGLAAEVDTARIGSGSAEYAPVSPPSGASSPGSIWGG